MPDQTSHSSRGWLAALLFTCLFLYAFPIWWGLPAAGSQSRTWAFDEVRPTQGETARQRHGGRYPPLHYALLRVAHAPVQELRARGVLDLDPRESTMVLQLVSRSVSLLMALATVWLVYRAGRLLLDRRWSVFAAATAASMTPLAFYAKTANLEVPYIFWFTASLIFFIKAYRRHQSRDYLCFATAATLSICTKDQAYGLFLLPSLALVWHLRRHAHGGSPAVSGLARTLVDRRIVFSFLLGAGLFAWIHGLHRGTGDFLHHLRVITGSGSAPFQIWEATLSGQVSMAAKAVRHVAFTMSPPLFLVALLGIAIAIARPSLRSRWIPSLLFPLSYYLTFIAVILYHYVRFFLPVGIVLSLFAALGAKIVWERTRRARPWVTLGLATTLAYALSVSLSLDLHMLFDTRYVVERWMAEQRAAGRRVLLIGNRRQQVPRAEVMIPIDRVRRHRQRLLPSADPDYLVINESQFYSPGERALLEELKSGTANFVLERRFHRRPPLDLFDTEGLVTNLSYVNPEITVLRRLGPWGMSGAELAEELRRAARSPRTVNWWRLAEEIERSHRLEPTHPADWITAYNLRSDGWMEPGERAALLVSNRRALEATFSLVLSCATTKRRCVGPVALLTLGERHEVRVEQGDSLRVDVTTLAPGETSLVVVEIAAEPAGEERSLRLRGYQLRPSEAI